MGPGRKTRGGAWLLLGLMLLGWLAGCAGRTKPEWVLKGRGAFPEEDRHAFYGVGSIQGIANRSLALSAADNRARAEIAKILETYTAALMRDYTSATTAGSPQGSSLEQHLEHTIKTVTTKTVSGVEVIDRWVDADGTIYSLARLRLDAVKAHLEQAPELQADVRAYIQQHAEQAFEKLLEEERRQRR